MDAERPSNEHSGCAGFVPSFVYRQDGFELSYVIS